MSAMNTLIETSKSLSAAERLSLAMGILATLQSPEVTAKKPKAAKEPKAADAPKKEANWFVQALAPVRAALKPLIEAHNAALPEGSKKLAGTVAPQVGRVLKEAGQLSAEIKPTEAQIKAAFHSFLASPPTPKTSSVASEGGGKAAAKPKAELSEEEAAAKRAQKAAKAKATREANKAKKAEVVVEPFTDISAAEEVTSIEKYEWCGDIGKGTKPYERIDYNGTSYIYTADGEAFVGEWNDTTKILKRDGYDIKNN